MFSSILPNYGNANLNNNNYNQNMYSGAIPPIGGYSPNTSGIQSNHYEQMMGWDMNTSRLTCKI